MCSNLRRHRNDVVALWYRRAVVVIATILGLAAIGITCGWLLRNELVERDQQRFRETRYPRTLLSAQSLLALDPPSGVTLPPGVLMRVGGDAQN